MRVIESLDALRGLIGQEVAVSDWVEITQQQVNQFAEPRETASGSTWMWSAPGASRRSARRWRTVS